MAYVNEFGILSKTLLFMSNMVSEHDFRGWISVLGSNKQFGSFNSFIIY